MSDFLSLIIMSALGGILIAIVKIATEKKPQKEEKANTEDIGCTTTREVFYEILNKRNDEYFDRLKTMLSIDSAEELLPHLRYVEEHLMYLESLDEQFIKFSDKYTIIEKVKSFYPDINQCICRVAQAEYDRWKEMDYSNKEEFDKMTSKLLGTLDELHDQIKIRSNHMEAWDNIRTIRNNVEDKYSSIN